MKSRSLFAFLILFSLFVPRARSQTKDSLIALTQAALAVDSLQATDGAMLPFANEFIRQSRRHHVPAPLLAGITQIESKFEPFATRTEPAYQKNPIVKRAAKKWSKAHHGIPTAETELQDRSRSYGLMQPMGELAREQGYDSTYLATLYIPDLNIEQGAIKLDSLFKRYKRDTLAVISAYNLGSAKRSHGAYENAQYIYSVILATHFYEKALHYAYLHHQSKENLRLAHRDRDSTLDSCRPAKPSLQLQSDTFAFAHKSYTNGGGPIENRYDLDSRYGPDEAISSGESEFEDAIRHDPFFLLGSGLILACLLGLGFVMWRYERRWAGYDRSLLQQNERSLFGRSSAGSSYSEPRAGIRAPGFHHTRA